MSDKDTNNAAKLLTLWFVVFMVGLVIADECNIAAGLLLSAFVTIAVIIIVYCDWRNDQTRKRLNHYVIAAERVIKSEVLTTAQEKTFENKIKKYLDDRGVWFVKYFANGYTKSGIPDILCCVNGYFVGIEVKAPEGKPSEIQLFNIKKINAAGGFAFVLYPSAFGEFKRFIENLEHDRFDRDEIPEIWK